MALPDEILVIHTGPIGLTDAPLSVSDWSTARGQLDSLLAYQPIIKKIDATYDTTSNGPSSVAPLLFPVPANSVWRVEYVFSTYCYNNAGMRFGFQVPSGSPAMSMLATTTGPAVMTNAKFTASNAMSGIVCNTGGDNGFVRATGIFTIGATAGNCHILWNSATNGQRSSIDAGASMVALRIA